MTIDITVYDMTQSTEVATCKVDWFPCHW